MGVAELHEHTRQFLEEDALLGGGDVDAKVRILLKSEYLRLLGRYHHVNHVMTTKYGMDFDAFIASRQVREKDFSWDVESDAMSWESAVSGIRTIQRKLGELRKADEI